MIHATLRATHRVAAPPRHRREPDEEAASPARSATTLIAALTAVSLSSGSSHREAPNIMLDPSADNTDTYAFTANDAPASLTVVANWVPGGNPANGPNFFRFDDRARYYINIDNTGDGKADIRYRFVFKTTVSDTSYRQSKVGVQSFGDARLLQFQRYSIVRENYRTASRRRSRRSPPDLPVAPGNSGPKSFPNYNKVANEAIRVIGNAKYFAGQRDDAFFIDLGAAFDNINIRVADRQHGRRHRHAGRHLDPDDHDAGARVRRHARSEARVRTRRRQRHGRRVGLDGPPQAAGHQRPLRQQQGRARRLGAGLAPGHPADQRAVHADGQKDAFNKSQPEHGRRAHQEVPADARVRAPDQRADRRDLRRSSCRSSSACRRPTAPTSSRCS